MNNKTFFPTFDSIDYEDVTSDLGQSMLLSLQ